MKKIFLFLQLIFSIGMSAQTTVESVQVADMDEGAPICGKSIDLHKRILQAYNCDSTLIVFACDTTKKGKNTDTGYLYSLDANTLEVQWQKSLKLSLSKLYGVCSKGVLLSSTLKSTGKSLLTLSDTKTGRSLWTQYLYPVYFNDSLDIVVGLEKVGGSKTYAYRLSTGMLLWDAEIPMTKNVGWKDACMVDSTHLVVVGDAINEINIHSGEIKKVKAVTGISDTKGMMALALTNVLSAAVTIGFNSPFYYYYYNLNPYIITGLTSNILQVGSDLYISDRKSLYCLGADSLQTRWKYDFQDKEASTAHLLLRDGKILMLNYGYGNSLMRGTVKCGKPFLASFDAQTGDREKMFPLYDKKHVMNDGMLTESGVFLAGSDKAVYLSFADSAVISKDWNRSANGALTMVLRKPFYAFHGLAPKLTLVEAFDKVCPMQTSTNKLFVFNDKLDILESYDLYETFSVCFRLDDVLCIQNRDDKSNFRLIHPDGSSIGKLKGKPVATLLKGRNVLAVYDDHLTVFRL